MVQYGSQPVNHAFDLQARPPEIEQAERGRLAATRLFGRERPPTLLQDLSDTLIGTTQAA